MQSAPQSAYDQLMGHLYDAVTAQSGFQAFIEALRRQFDLKAVTMIIRHSTNDEVRGMWLAGLGMEWLESYALKYAGDDILADHIMAAPIAHFYASNLDVVHPQDPTSTRFFREWLMPQGVMHAAGAIVLKEGPWLTQLIFQRTQVQGPFAREEVETFDRLMPHMQRALQMRQRFAELQVGQDFLAGGFDVLAMPTFLFDERGMVAHCNKSAHRLLQAGSSLRLDDGHLQANNQATNLQLSADVAKAIRASRGDGSELGTVLLLPRGARQPLMLMVAPLKMSGGASAHGAALLFVFDPENTPAATAEIVARLFMLTEVEAELAVQLCRGRTLDDFAEERGTSPHTVRAQLRSVFMKTGTNRQSDLVALLVASPAFFVAQPSVPAVPDERIGGRIARLP